MNPYFEEVSNDGRFFSVGVFDRRMVLPAKNERILRVDVWYKGNITEAKASALRKELAHLALVSISDIDDYDKIQIDVSSRYDLAIASGFMNYGDIQSVKEWKRITDLD